MGRSGYSALLLIAVIIVASQVGGYFYLQSVYRTGLGNRTGTGPTTNPNLITVSTLINYGNATSLWYNESKVSVNTNFYNLTVTIANGNVEAQYYPTLNAHYVISINGVRNDGDGIHCTVCWTLWVYCNRDRAWSVSLLGADLIKLKNGDILAWYIQDTSQTPWQPPQAGSKTVPLCS